MYHNFIMGTAGHVDHGKTALIKALTNIECDTHKEEKKRGITINLGFAHITHPKGYEIGIVDVPGHKDFINTMVCGASGINFVLFVISADNGIMPQTVEHLKILDSLGIENGIIALTKIDLAESDLIDIAKEEIRELTKCTFLEDAPIIEVSSKTNNGIDNLKKCIFNCTEKLNSKLPRENDLAPFIMNIDRAFSIKGTGTVITGSVINGNLEKNTPIFILPDKKATPIKLRSLQKYNNETNELHPGERAAINITGIKSDAIKHRTIASNINLKTTYLVDSIITMFDDCSYNYKPEINYFHAKILKGRSNINAKFRVLFNPEINQKKNHYLTQIELKSECIARPGDRFIIRNTSEDKTIGAGIILDPFPLIHKKKTEKLKEALLNLYIKNPSYLIRNEINKDQGFTNINRISFNLNLSNREVIKLIDFNSNIYTVIEIKNNKFLIDKKLYKNITKEVSSILRKHHVRLPLSRLGLSTEAVANASSISYNKTSFQLIENILVELKKSNIVKLLEGTWILSSYEVKITAKLQQQINAVEEYLSNSGMTVPLMDKLIIYNAKFNINEKLLQQILKHLSGENKIYKIEDAHIHSLAVNKCRVKLINYLENIKDRITVAEFRDLVAGNRKICLLLLSQFDSEKTTIRKDNFRFLAVK